MLYSDTPANDSIVNSRVRAQLRGYYQKAMNDTSAAPYNG